MLGDWGRWRGDWGVIVGDGVCVVVVMVAEAGVAAIFAIGCGGRSAMSPLTSPHKEWR